MWDAVTRAIHPRVESVEKPLNEHDFDRSGDDSKVSDRKELLWNIGSYGA